MRTARGGTAFAWLSLVLLSGLGCATWRPVNVRLAQVDPDHGYRPALPSQHREPGRIWLTLAFSGGGTRAAALAYGVLEALRDTEIVIDGERLRLLDEVDAISGVSGGSFPAAYYGLFGDRIFEDFEQRFLKRNVQGALIRRVLNPIHWIALSTLSLSRSDLASDYYHEHVFDGATFADLKAASGPRIHINATDLLTGHPFRFNQGAFDVICSDLDPFPIARAVAASSAVPVLLSPVTLRNHAGSCGLETPPWFDEALESRLTNPRGYRAARSILDFMDSDRKKYIHLVDGGISDNLALRLPLDRIALIGDIEKARLLSGLDVPDQLVMIVVNAETEPDPAVGLTAAAPSLAASLNLVSGSQIRRFNFETLLLARQSVADYAETLSASGKQVTGIFIEVSFDLLEAEERRYFKRLPTSFKLSDEQVDRLREVGGRLLRASPEFQGLLGMPR